MFFYGIKVMEELCVINATVKLKLMLKIYQGELTSHALG